MSLYQNSSIKVNVIKFTPNTESLSVKGDSKIDVNIGGNCGNGINVANEIHRFIRHNLIGKDSRNMAWLAL